MKAQLVAVFHLDGKRGYLLAVHLQRGVIRKIRVARFDQGVHLQSVAQTVNKNGFTRWKRDASPRSHEFRDAELKFVRVKVWRRREWERRRQRRRRRVWRRGGRCRRRRAGICVAHFCPLLVVMSLAVYPAVLKIFRHFIFPVLFATTARLVALTPWHPVSLAVFRTIIRVAAPINFCCEVGLITFPATVRFTCRHPI